MAYVSANRVIAVTPPWTRTLTWPMADPDDYLDYTLDLSAALADVSDTISSVSISAAPSGSGEITLSRASHTNTTAVFWATGGQPTRIYTIQVVAMTAAGREFAFYPLLPISSASMITPPPPPPSPGFGSAITG